jgi:hypothetical protein
MPVLVAIGMPGILGGVGSALYTHSLLLQHTYRRGLGAITSGRAMVAPMARLGEV